MVDGPIHFGSQGMGDTHTALHWFPGCVVWCGIDNEDDEATYIPHSRRLHAATPRYICPASYTCNATDDSIYTGHKEEVSDDETSARTVMDRGARQSAFVYYHDNDDYSNGLKWESL